MAHEHVWSFAWSNALAAVLILTACSSGGDGGVDDAAVGAGTGAAAGMGTGGSTGTGSTGEGTSGAGTNGGGGNGLSGTGGDTGGSGGSGGASTTGLSLTEACLEYAAAQLVRRAECEGAPEPLPAGLVERTLDQCPDVFFSDGSRRTAEELLDCADAWRALPCEQYLAGLRPPCVSDGTRAGGEACLFPSQCASQRCGSAGPTTCGACGTRVGPGESCDDLTRVCPLGHDCQGTCVENVVGAPWTPPARLSTGAECGDTRDLCTGWDRCMSDAEGVQRCTPPIAVGQGCGGVSAFCDREGYCDPDFVCQARPGDGEPCAEAYDGRMHCRLELACKQDDPEGPTCRPAPAATCTVENQYCATGTICCLPPECPTAVCAEVQLPGEACTDPTTICIAGSECRTGTCEPLDSQGLFDALCGSGG